MDEDYALALQLQAEFLEEPQNFNLTGNHSDVTASHGTEPQSLVDPYWEVTDPNPDVRALFLQFNERFFWGRLAGIEVRWSPRMTLCAGLCCYEGRGGLCSVRLSVPLLKLRPRKDLIETLLHEMIHAYLFVTDNNKDHDGHGPEFHKHMYRINKEAGTNISVYHNFHDEVDSYRQHWWRCDGPCRSRKPYFGYVKRSMNRAPSKNDTWWAEHQRTCGGTYTKVKEPEDYGKKKGKKEKDGENEKKKDKEKSAVKSMDIRIFGGEGKTLGNVRPGQSSTDKFNLPNMTKIPPGSLLKPTNSINKPKPSATVSKHEDSLPSSSFGKDTKIKTSENGHVTHLPGLKTPDKKSVSKNKPVSQGGVGQFNNKRSFDLPDFSDSDDSDDLLCSVPLEKLTNSSVHSNTNDKAHTSKDVESWWDSDSDSLNVSTKVSDDKCDIENLIEGSNNQSEFSISIETSESITDCNQAQSTENEVNDVREMLRKVWGQKQFGNKHNKVKVTGTFKSGNINGEIHKNPSLRHSNKETNTGLKRLSEDTGFYTSQTSKRKRASSDTSIYSPYKSSEDINTGELPKNGKLTSPIDKFFKKVEKTSQDSGESLPTEARNTEKSSLVKGDNFHTRDGGLVSAPEMSTCPVCCKSVITTSINEHLDRCLTMQAI